MATDAPEVTPDLTPADVEQFTRGELSASVPGLQDRLDAALEDVRSYCGWHVFPARRETLILDPHGSSLLQLPSLQVDQVHTVTEHGVLVPPGSITWSAKGMIAKRAGCWSSEFRSVAVDLTHGYANAKNVRGVILSIVARGANAPTNVISETVGGRSETRGSVNGTIAGITPMLEEWSILDRYQLPALT